MGNWGYNTTYRGYNFTYNWCFRPSSPTELGCGSVSVSTTSGSEVGPYDRYTYGPITPLIGVMTPVTHL